MRVLTSLVGEALEELSDDTYQARVWTGATTGVVSSLEECLAQLFDDSGLGDALDRKQPVFGRAIDDRLNALSNVVGGIET